MKTCDRCKRKLRKRQLFYEVRVLTFTNDVFLNGTTEDIWDVCYECWRIIKKSILLPKVSRHDRKRTS